MPSRKSNPGSPDVKPGDQSIGVQLAAALSGAREQMTEEWLTAVRRNKEIEATERLSPGQLTAQLPALLDDLSAVLRDAFNRELKQEAAYTAATHGHIRWQAGYDLSELLRELSELRAILIHHLVSFLETHPEFGGASRLFAMATVHRFVDDAMRVSVEQFLASGERAQTQPPPAR